MRRAGKVRIRTAGTQTGSQPSNHTDLAGTDPPKRKPAARREILSLQGCSAPRSTWNFSLEMLCNFWRSSFIHSHLKLPALKTRRKAEMSGFEEVFHERTARRWSPSRWFRSETSAGTDPHGSPL